MSNMTYEFFDIDEKLKTLVGKANNPCFNGLIKFSIRQSHYTLGLQVTQRCDDYEKLREFNSVHSSGFQVVDRVLYVEVEQSDFEKGVGHPRIQN